jgi:hypothetical protein
MKLDLELIEAYLDGSLDKASAAELKLWLKEHPGDQAKVQRQARLRELLSGSAVAPSAAQSRRMWANIKARAKAEAVSTPVLEFSEPWYAFIFKPWGGGLLSAGMATAALLVLAFVWHPWQTQAPMIAPTEAGPALTDAAAPVAQANASDGSSSREEAAPMKKVAAAKAETDFAPEMNAPPAAASAAPMVAEKAAARKAPAREANEDRSNPGPTEVELALADSGVDGMIDSYLAAHRQAPSRPMAAAGRSASTPLVGLSQYSAREESRADDRPSSTAQGRRDSNGFWDWRPVTLAMNRRDLPQLRVELDAARVNAAESVERSFASSVLTLLSAPGAPLTGTGELRVLGTGGWQLDSANRMARFSGGVSTRLPGFRSEGDSLLLDLTFDRGTFSPGTRFTRVSGDAPAEVLDAQGRPLAADEFNAPTGAVYNVSGRQLKLY